MSRIHYVVRPPRSHLRRHFVTPTDVATVLDRLPNELLSCLRKVVLNDEGRGNRILGYTTTKGRQDIALCALPSWLSFRAGHNEFGAVPHCPWPVLAVRRRALYDTLLHEIGHLQVVDRKATSARRRFADERLADEFAIEWRSRLWATPFDHPDPVHNRPSAEEIEGITKSWATSHAAFKEGLVLERTRKDESAAECYVRALACYSRHCGALGRLGALKYRGVGTPQHTGTAHRLLSEANRLDCTEPVSCLYYACALAESGDLQGAHGQFKRAASLHWYPGVVWCQYGVALAKHDRFVESNRLFKKALRINPNVPLVPYTYAKSILGYFGGSGGCMSKAVRLLRRAHELRPKDPDVRCLLAIGLAREGVHRDEARRQLLWALDRNPGDEEILELLDSVS